MIPTRLLTKGGECIQFGLGTYPLQGEAMACMVMEAVKVGYRLFDTSDDYRGESGIGIGVKRLMDEGVSREQLFLQTKISDDSSYPDQPFRAVYFNENSPFMQRHTAGEVVREKVQTSLRELQTDYIDSLLIHLPYTGFYADIWKEMIKIKEEGLLRYIGVSNFSERHIDCLIRETGIRPDINEVYLSPIATKTSLVEYCVRNGIALMTYSPLMDLVTRRVPLSVLEPLSKKYGKSIAQIVLRWNIERGCIPLPRTKNPKRLTENINVFDFELAQKDVEAISALNKNYQYCVESRMCPGV